MALLAAVIALSLPAPVCAPDYTTQLPVVCQQNVRAPFVAFYPVSQDGIASFSERHRHGRRHALQPWVEWGCTRLLRHGGMVAAVSRCLPGGIGVALFQIDRRPRRRVEITVAGGPPNE